MSRYSNPCRCSHQLTLSFTVQCSPRASRQWNIILFFLGRTSASFYHLGSTCSSWCYGYCYQHQLSLIFKFQCSWMSIYLYRPLSYTLPWFLRVGVLIFDHFCTATCWSNTTTKYSFSSRLKCAPNPRRKGNKMMHILESFSFTKVQQCFIPCFCCSITALQHFG